MNPALLDETLSMVFGSNFPSGKQLLLKCQIPISYPTNSVSVSNRKRVIDCGSSRSNPESTSMKILVLSFSWANYKHFAAEQTTPGVFNVCLCRLVGVYEQTATLDYNSQYTNKANASRNKNVLSATFFRRNSQRNAILHIYLQYILLCCWH